MPKPGRNNNFERGGGDYRGGNSTRRVTFKPNRHRDKNDKGHKDWGNSLRSHLEEDDVDMSFGANGYNKNFNKKNFKKKGSGLPIPVLNARRKLPVATWYRITIPYGNKYDKSFILQTLIGQMGPLPLIPLCWTANGTTATFYVDDHKVADKLYKLDREIQYPDGFKMIIKVITGSPNVTITPELKERIKLVMGKRYNAAVRALDLSKFHLDPELRDSFCALSKPLIFLAVMEIIAKNIPELEAIDLSHNHIQIFISLKNIKEDFKNLKILHMGNNKIPDIAKLDPLIGLPVVELVLDGNPLCDRYTEQVKYISEVRKRFPKVIKLDGIDLPPPIGFDIENEAQLPSSQQTFLCTQDGQGIVRQFLEQYFNIFDSDNRQPLVHAYHENVFFSMTMAYPYGQKQNSAWLDWYATDSRNLQRIHNTERRRSLLKQGQVSVVSYLSDMPNTKHDLQSFTVDLTLFTPQMLTLIVSGMYKELRTAHKAPPIRYFFRSFVIVPAGSGFCIINEQLHVTNATEEQTKNAFKVPVPAPAVANVAAESTKLGSSTNVPDEQVKQQMVQTLAQQTGMNLEYSQKCLQETEWDFSRATLVFGELQKQGVIPPEAFVR